MARVTLTASRGSRSSVVRRRVPVDASRAVGAHNKSSALRRARRNDGAAKRRRAADALSAMERSGEAVTFPAVARRAGVSVSLRYADG